MLNFISPFRGEGLWYGSAMADVRPREKGYAVIIYRGRKYGIRWVRHFLILAGRRRGPSSVISLDVLKHKSQTRMSVVRKPVQRMARINPIMQHTN